MIGYLILGTFFVTLMLISGELARLIFDGSPVELRAAFREQPFYIKIPSVLLFLPFLIYAWPVLFIMWFRDVMK